MRTTCTWSPVASWIMSRAPPCVSARLSASRARTGVADLGVPVPSPRPRWQKTAMSSRWTDALADQARSQERLFHHCYGELIEAIADDESLVTRMAFGCLSCYLHGRLKVVLADGEPPWDGVLVPTASEQHVSQIGRASCRERGRMPWGGRRLDRITQG